MSESKENITAQLLQLRETVFAYFDRCRSALGQIDKQTWLDRNSNEYWPYIPRELSIEADSLTERLVTVAQKIAFACKNSLLVDPADLREIPIQVKRMRSAIRLRRYYYSDAEVVHDEGIVLGFRPASQEDGEPEDPKSAKRGYQAANDVLIRILQLADNHVSFSGSDVVEQVSQVQKYRSNSAFIMMWMDAAQPQLEDVRDAVCDTFRRFGIRALRADDIEHEGSITQRILDEVRRSEFLFADLTGARPNVYYEVGFAHALGKRVILFRKKGTGLHFDLAGYNCPEYENLRDLKEKITKRLESLTNKQAREEG